MGYGLDDIQKNDDRFTFHPDSKEYYNNLHDEEKQKAFLKSVAESDDSQWNRPFHDYYIYLDKKEDLLQHRIEPYEIVKYESEGGLKEVLVMKPVIGFKKWYRYDDDIDGYEASFISPENPCMPNLKTLRWSCLYPFQGFVDAQTGEIFKDNIFAGIRKINRLLPENRSPDEYNNSWDELEKCSGGKYKTFAEYEKFVYPIKPPSIVDYANFFKIFKDDKTVHTLKPMIYTYWS